MCLYYDGQKTRKYRQEWKKSGSKTRTFLKGVLVYKNLKGEYFIQSYWMQHWWNIGETVSSRSNRKLSGTESRRQEVYEGIHVYTDQHKGISYSMVPIEVTVEVNDLVGLDAYNGDAVFMKVNITKEARQAAIDYAIKNNQVCPYQLRINLK